MEKDLRNINVWCWKYLENSRTYPGLHLTAKPESCDKILNLLDTIIHEGPDRSRSLLLKPLAKSDEAKITGGQKFLTFEKLKISWHSSSDKIFRSAFLIENNIPHFYLTDKFLADFKKGILDIKEGRGDYALHPNFQNNKEVKLLGELDKLSEDLWIWPCFGHLWVEE